MQDSGTVRKKSFRGASERLLGGQTGPLSETGVIYQMTSVPGEYPSLTFTSPEANVSGSVDGVRVASMTNVLVKGTSAKVGEYIQFQALQNKWIADGNMSGISAT